MTASRWRAPREDGTALVVPAWQQLPDLIEQNRSALAASTLYWQDRTLLEARELAFAEAQRLTGAALQRPLLVTGHQPELFHPGVWAKNVAISELAPLVGGSSLNFNVDSDVTKTTALKLPMADGSGADEVVRFSQAQRALPYEEWHSDDEAAFASLPERIAPITGAWPWQPVLPQFWQRAVQADPALPLPQRWVQARLAWERAHAIHNHELTMSQWCQTSFFHWLLQLFVTDHARFANIYNDELHAYRREHRIRSANHPVADLLVTSDLVELPFWAWPTGTTQRGRLCMRHGRELIALIAGKELVVTQDSALSTQDLTRWKIRPKALITSMMYRLFLADLFVHGIGGAIYDELTDRIFAKFWNIPLPRFAIVTATLRLPWPRQAISESQPRLLRHTLRDMQWNPDRFLPTDLPPEQFQHRKRKQELMTMPVSLSALHERHVQFAQIREALSPVIFATRERTDQLLHQTLTQLKIDEHQFSREHPWVLYPEAQLARMREIVKE